MPIWCSPCIQIRTVTVLGCKPNGCPWLCVAFYVFVIYHRWCKLCPAPPNKPKQYICVEWYSTGGRDGGWWLYWIFWFINRLRWPQALVESTADEPHLGYTCGNHQFWRIINRWVIPLTVRSSVTCVRVRHEWHELSLHIFASEHLTNVLPNVTIVFSK